MSRNYEGVIVFNAKGSEEGIEEMTQSVSALLQEHGAQVEETENLGRKDFAYAPDRVEAGHFVKFLFSLDPAQLDTLKAALKLREEVYYQSYERV